MKTFAIIPSGGTGNRIGTDLPKQYLQFNGKELIAYTIDIFQKCDLIDDIIISACKDYFDLLHTIKNNYSFSKISKIVEGGEERQHSVSNALKSINANDDDLIIVHDAVRPLLPRDILIKAIETAKISGSAVVAIKAKDTLVKGLDSVISYIDRQDIFYVQTPQIFHFRILMDAFIKAEKEEFIGTDESMLVQRAGNKVNIVSGSSFNFKITTEEDLLILDNIIQNR